MKLRVSVHSRLVNVLTAEDGLFTTLIDVTPEEHARITAWYAEWDSVQDLIDERVTAAQEEGGES